MYKEIQVAIPTYQRKSIFDYYVTQDCQLGDVVKIPFRNSEIWGVIVGVEKTRIAKDKLKEVLLVSDSARFSVQQINFFKFAAYYNMSSIGNVLKLAMPAEFSDSIVDSSSTSYKHNSIKLSDEQKCAAEVLINKVKDNKHSVTLVDGVTGSGKTEVYSTAIDKILSSKEGQVLVLLPEIMLTNQFVNRFENIFGVKPDVWHSDVSKKRKKELLGRIINGRSRLVIGARSSLFLPFNSLKLIIVDEEHDHSYKQEDGIIYNARDMAIACGYYNDMPVFLASATPSIETMHNVYIAKYSRVEIGSRYGGAKLPKINIVDMSKSKMGKNRWISPLLEKKVSQYLSEDKQVMLFLNRRGYAPITLCKSCGHKEVCKDCATFLVAHKGTQKLLCHYCGYSKNIEPDCSECNEKGTLINCGPGVERIADEVKSLWPEAKNLIVTRDTVSQDTQTDILDQILNKEAKIIIGTQILSKGHHFPSLDLVGIIDADIGLFGADLRSSEKTFQLLTQVSGRAGRESEGEVVIQTYYPKNPILDAISIGNREGFYELEVDSRRKMSMPPFTRLVSIIISGSNERHVIKFADNLAKSIEYDKKVVVLGPVVAPMSYIRGKYRYRFLVKSFPGSKVQDYVSRWLNKNSTPSSLRLKIDVDPYNFM